MRKVRVLILTLVALCYMVMPSFAITGGMLSGQTTLDSANVDNIGAIVDNNVVTGAVFYPNGWIKCTFGSTQIINKYYYYGAVNDLRIELLDNSDAVLYQYNIASTGWRNIGQNISGVKAVKIVYFGTKNKSVNEVDVGYEFTDTDAPEIPNGLFVNPDVTTASITWSAVADSDLAGYKLYRDGVLLDDVGNVTIYTDTGLTAETSYSYQVSSYDSNGNESEKSIAVNVTTLEEPDTTPPAIPTGLTTNSNNPTAVELSWNENTESDFSSYNIYRDGVKIKGTAINSANDSGLTPNTTYAYTITAVDSSGNESAQSNQVQVTTLDLTTPGIITVTNVTDVSATLQWDLVNGSEEYNIYLDGVLTGTTTETIFDLYNLSPDTEYTLTLTSLFGDQESEQSEPVTFSTAQAPVMPPGEPIIEVSKIYGTGTVKLSWSLDDPTISTWEVYMNEALIYELPGGTNETIIRGLEDGDYDFKVRAVNSAGAGEYSETLTADISNILNFVPKLGDIFAMIGSLFKSMWPLIAFALALIIVPRLSRYLITIVANK